MNIIANRIGMPPDDLRYIFKHICKGRYDSFMIDLSADCKPEWKYRKNVYEPISIDDDDATELQNAHKPLTKKDIAEAFDAP